MRRLTTLALVVGLALLSGCQGGDDPDPKVSPTESSSGTPTPTPTGPVEPTLPAEAEGDDAAAAEAFVRFYWDVVNYAQATGDVDLLGTLGTPTCKACSAGRASIEETYGAGGSIEGGEAYVLAAKATRLRVRTGRAFSVDADVQMAPQVIRTPGEEDFRSEGGVYDFAFIVEPNGGWRVARWSVDQ